MHWVASLLVTVITLTLLKRGRPALLLKPESLYEGQDNGSRPAQPEQRRTSPVPEESTSHQNGVDLNDAQESTNFFSAFDSPVDLFDNFPYFPEFGEIFRIQRTTTPAPPFAFPDYVRDAFPPEGSSRIPSNRRRSRRPPRPASSGTRTKVSKHNNHNEPKEKTKTSKSKTPVKSKDYPKIFRFTADRVNLAEFDMKKKTNENYLTLTKGDDLDSEKVKRNNFLILHGGIFEIERSMRSPGVYRARRAGKHGSDSLDDDLYGYSSNSENERTRVDRLPYFYSK